MLDVSVPTIPQIQDPIFPKRRNPSFCNRESCKDSGISPGTITETDEATKSYKKKHLILAIDYSGRFDILHACKSIVKKSEQGLIREEDVDETLFERELQTKCTEFPSPDLLIRTSGEQRISNFFFWQLAYTELFFSPVLWPDFDKKKLLEALVSYQRRERRFGCRL